EAGSWGGEEEGDSGDSEEAGSVVVHADEEWDEIRGKTFQAGRVWGESFGSGGIKRITGLGAVSGKTEKRNQIFLDIKHRRQRR
ncbi:MAG: hypothetical protein LBU19_07100, partial [Treponema sp.]|nr:hypothetical protein [Treponema sp.]